MPHQRPSLIALKALTGKHGMHVWFTVHTHRHEKPGQDGLPASFARFPISLIWFWSCKPIMRILTSSPSRAPYPRTGRSRPPLRGFTLPSGIRRVLFVAGGVGVAPLVYLLHSGLLASKAGHEIQKNFYLGARSAELLLCLDQFGDFCELEICTTDGSQGITVPLPRCSKMNSIAPIRMSQSSTPAISIAIIPRIPSSMPAGRRR